jgi:hypothetical protein
MNIKENLKTIWRNDLPEYGLPMPLVTTRNIEIKIIKV